MINIFEVSETNKMIEQENLDVRTITMGISLLDCISSDLDVLNENIYNKITTLAKDLVSTGEKISMEYGIPIVNKRISVTPIALIGGAACKTPEDFVTIAKTLDRAAHTVGVNFIGGYSALVSKGMTKAEELLIRSIPQALAETERVCSSVNVGSTKTGINMDAVKLMGEIVLATAEASKEQDSLGCAKLVVFCNAPDDNPFMAGAFHGVTEEDCIINVGVSGPGVVKTALESVRGADFETLCETIKKTAFKVTRVGQLVAMEASQRLHVPFGIVDLSLAPTPAIGDSVAEILQEIGLERAGAPGTTAALALLNDQVKKGGVMASTAVGGLSGAFIPVSEDQGMIDAVKDGALTIEKLEAMTCVCSVGLDMIAIPGDTKASTISGIIADEAAIGMINQKTTAVRVIPVIGKGVGETVEFGGLLGYAPIMPVNSFSCDRFVARGGRIPAPVHSFKN
ncbi:MAG: PFL family protein [Eubacteriales bacterium]|nr:PFL family protein [Eubacteriales bacterium]